MKKFFENSLKSSRLENNVPPPFFFLSVCFLPFCFGKNWKIGKLEKEEKKRKDRKKRKNRLGIGWSGEWSGEGGKDYII